MKDNYQFSPNTLNHTYETFDIAKDIDMYPCSSNQKGYVMNQNNEY